MVDVSSKVVRDLTCKRSVPDRGDFSVALANDSPCLSESRDA